MYDLEIHIPKGRRPGKYLRQNAPEGFGADFSGLVESLEYRPCLASSKKDWLEAARRCHSCQSDNEKKRQNYATFWRATPTQLAILRDANGDIVARALVRPEWASHAPAYGHKQYMLEARLKYAGYTQGRVLTTAEIKLAESGLTDGYIRQGYLGITRPKSVMEVRNITMYSPAPRLMSALALYHNWATYRRPVIRLSKRWRLYLSRKEDGQVWGMSQRFALTSDESRIKSELQKAKTEWRWWCRQCRLAGVGDPWEIDTLTRKIASHRLAKKVVWRKELIRRVQTSVYIDCRREFLTLDVLSPRGYYAKEAQA